MMDKQVQVGAYEKEDLRRELKSRHLQMIAIGGAIGTGLFYGSSWLLASTLAEASCIRLLAFSVESRQ